MKPIDLPKPRTSCPACHSERKVCEEVMRGKLPDAQLPQAHLALVSGTRMPQGLVMSPVGFDCGSQLIQRVAEPAFEICGDCGCVYVKYWRIMEAKPSLATKAEGNGHGLVRP